jgi:hypothetical protein
MATLDSTSTDAEVLAAYMDNCGYREDDSSSMASAFITACTAMMARGVSRFQHGDEGMQFSLEDLRALMSDAKDFVRQKGGVTSGGGGVIHLDTSRMRG